MILLGKCLGEHLEQVGLRKTVVVFVHIIRVYSAVHIGVEQIQLLESKLRVEGEARFKLIGLPLPSPLVHPLPEVVGYLFKERLTRDVLEPKVLKLADRMLVE